MSIESLGRYFGAIEDPRCPGKIEHRLIEVLVVAVWGCKPKPQKIRSSQIQPRRDRIQVYDLRIAA